MEFVIVVFVMAVVALVIKYLTFDHRFDRKDIQREIDGRDVSNPKYYLPYKIRRTIMSEHERLLFDNLRVVLGTTYDVYPQIKLDKIFGVERQRAYKYYLGWLRRINQKSVDFLVVKRDTQSPIFAIELDDSSHEDENRIDRDKFVGELFKRNNFPLIRFNAGQYRVEELKVVLKQYLNKF